MSDTRPLSIRDRADELVRVWDEHEGFVDTRWDEAACKLLREMVALWDAITAPQEQPQ